MLIVKTKIELKTYLEAGRKQGLSIGFVPTMGALHSGHISLIERAKAENNISLCSIFVNPTQFNDPKDLERYPKTPESDITMLETAGCDVLFMPLAAEMYPSGGTSSPTVDLKTLNQVMEGKNRPGHFQGVIQIVSIFFELVQPDRSYFGQKDFQQLAVVREMVGQLHYSTEIIGCAIIREPDGLAMSSRNVLLPPADRKLAPVISEILFKVKEMASSTSVANLIRYASEKIAATGSMTLEYFEVADATTLLPVTDLSEAASVVACIAVRLGKVRLIDNIILKA
jgi:pantoate--beta-alanine ligase